MHGGRVALLRDQSKGNILTVRVLTSPDHVSAAIPLEDLT